MTSHVQTVNDVAWGLKDAANRLRTVAERLAYFAPGSDAVATLAYTAADLDASAEALLASMHARLGEDLANAKESSALLLKAVLGGAFAGPKPPPAGPTVEEAPAGPRP